MSESQCDCANMNGHMCYPCLEKDYYAISADNFRLVHKNEHLRKLMSDYVSLWLQVESQEWTYENTKAYYAKFHEMKQEVRGD